MSDAVIVGGGVIGLSLAYELARRGCKPVVLDRGPEPGAATRAAAGMLAPVSEADVEPQALVDLGLDSLARFPGLVAGIEARTGLSCGFREEGTLWVALDRDQAAELSHLEAALARKKLACLRLSTAELLEREPLVSSRAVAGLLVEGDIQIDPRALCVALEAALVSLGGEVHRGVEVEAVEAARAGELRVRAAGAPSGMLHTSTIVVATGAWAGERIRLPIDLPRVRPVKGQLVRLRGAEQLSHVLRNPECYLVPRAGGELLIGATVEESGYDARPSAGAVHDLLRHARRLVPGIYDLEFVEVSVGLRPALEDHLPAIGPTSTPGLFLAIGHYRNGVLLAPATAHHLADAILGGRVPAELAPFALDRASLRAPRTAVPR